MKQKESVAAEPKKPAVFPTKLIKITNLDQIVIPEEYRECNPNIVKDCIERTRECFTISGFTMQPIKVKQVADGKYMLLNHRELFEACKHNNLPVFVYEDKSSEESQDLMYNMSAQDLAHTWSRNDHMEVGLKKGYEAVANLDDLLNTKYTNSKKEKKLSPTTLADVFSKSRGYFEGTTISGSIQSMSPKGEIPDWSNSETFTKKDVEFGKSILTYFGTLYNNLNPENRCSWDKFVKEMMKCMRTENKDNYDVTEKIDRNRMSKVFEEHGHELYTKGATENILWNVAYFYNKGRRKNFMQFTPGGKNKNKVKFGCAENNHKDGIRDGDFWQ